MACTRGRVRPTTVTRLRLFADSGGYCQRPQCLTYLFRNVEDARILIAEMAHIVAAVDGGPRANAELSPEERGAYENLLLLCPTCHTLIDAAPSEHPDATVRQWKQEHTERIAAAFGAREYASRTEARVAVEPILAENGAIFNQYGPDQDYASNPESEMAEVWRTKVLEHILPNNRKILAILDANRHHLTVDERATLESFRQHIDDLEDRHLGEGLRGAGTTFPSGMSTILEGNNA